MTKDIIERNRELYIKEFKATGRQGVDHIISYLDSHHFFEARCNGHDREPGGTANHSLWVLKMARETRAAILKKDPERDIPEDELVFTCLLHDICDCNPKQGIHGRRSREILEKRIKGFAFSNDVLDAVNSHMHGNLYGNKDRSSQDSTTRRELLHYLVHNSDHRAIEYASGIPFDEVPIIRTNFKLCDDGDTDTVRYDHNGHRYWWTCGPSSIWKDVINLDSLPEKAAQIKGYLDIKEDGSWVDLAILKDEKGHMALFVVKSVHGHGGPVLMSSDRAGFDYTEFIIYVSRYPRFRPSYIVGHKTNGKWGIVAAQSQAFKRNGLLVEMTPVVGYEHDDAESAVNAMRRNNHQIRVKHSSFFEKIVIH